MKLIIVGALGVVVGHAILGPIAGKSIGASIVGAIAFDGLYRVIGVFSDILSYVRITALGLSTSIVAGVISQMTLQMKGILLALGILIPLQVDVFTGGNAINAEALPVGLMFLICWGLIPMLYIMRSSFIGFFKRIFGIFS